MEYKQILLFSVFQVLLNNQIETVTQSLNECTDELLILKKDNSLRSIQLETKLTEKTKELSIANENIKAQTDLNNNLSEKIEELTEKLKAQCESDAKTHELYQQELEAQNKLAELYKGMSEQSKEHAEDLSKAVTEVCIFLFNIKISL